MQQICMAGGIASPCVEGCVSAAYAYVPPQCVERFYDYDSALQNGTIFPDLTIPQGCYGPKETFRM